MSKCPIRVSDHALVRYAERVQGVDLGPRRRDIARRVAAAADAGANAVVIDGWRYVIEDRVVVTVMPHVQADIRTGRVKRRREIDDDA